MKRCIPTTNFCVQKCVWIKTEAAHVGIHSFQVYRVPNNQIKWKPLEWIILSTAPPPLVGMNQRSRRAHNTFNPKFILSIRNAGMGGGAETEGMAN